MTSLRWARRQLVVAACAALFVGLGPTSALRADGSAEVRIMMTVVALRTTPYLAHFENPAANQIPALWTELDNAQIRTTGTGTAKAACLGAKNSGSVASEYMRVDLSTFGTLRVTVAAVDAGTGNSLWIHGNGLPPALLDQNLAAGIHEYNLTALTGWSGIRIFRLEFGLTSATAGLGTTLDEVWVYATASNGFVEHFRAAGAPPAGWTPDANAQLAADGLGSAVLTATKRNVWGQAESAAQTLNLDTTGFIRVVVTASDAGLENRLYARRTSGGAAVLLAQNYGTGVLNLDLRTLTGWTGSQTFTVQLRLRAGTVGQAVRYDEIKIGSREC